MLVFGPGGLPETGTAIGTAMRDLRNAMEGKDLPPSGDGPRPAEPVSPPTIADRTHQAGTGGRPAAPSVPPRHRLRVDIASTLGAAVLVLACSSAPVPSPVASPARASPLSSAPTASLPPASAPPPPSASLSSPPASLRPVTLAPRRTIGGPRPDIAALITQYQYGEAPVPLERGAALTDWHLSRPNLHAVAGWAGKVSVPAGGRVELHLRAIEPAVRLDVFRVGAHDATHLATVARVAVRFQPDARPSLPVGRVETHWPVSYTLPVPTSWRSGFYLVKVTTLPAGYQAYVPFAVTATRPAPLLVVLPMLSYQAYNGWGGSDLYDWWKGPFPRAAEASFDRPYEHGYGAGMLFRLDFPLLVWLEDEGYAPAYTTDLDVARNPSLVVGSRVVILSGHPEYWLGADRDAFDAAQARGVSLLGMGANMAYMQVRLLPNSAGVPERTVVCYKSLAWDPLAAGHPSEATVRFQNSPIRRPPKDLLGEEYGGIVPGLAPMVLGPDIARFAPNTGLRPGQSLPGLIGDEIDVASSKPGALLLAKTPVHARGYTPNFAGASLWVTPSGAHTFDAGTFDWSWGLDPRWSAALPGFPARAFAQLTADILAWAGAYPRAS